jgi:FAD synthase
LRDAVLRTHLFDVERDLFGAALSVHLLGRLREARIFSGVVEVRALFARDFAAARAVAAGCNPDPSALGAWF